MYDVIIIGMGISGISAGLYAKQANLKTLMFESKMPGGLLNIIDEVSNYTGLINIKGSDFALELFKQINDAGIEFKNEGIIDIKDFVDYKVVKTANSEYKTKNVIIATGRSPKLLGLKNEKDLLGKGLSTCAVCDGNFYKDKVVTVVGSGNSALQESLYLANIVESINLLIRKDKFSGSADLVNKVLLNKKIKVYYNSSVTSINLEKDKIKSVLINDNQEIYTDGLFIYVGYEPVSNIVKKFGVCDDANYIIVNSDFETKIKGIYAVGDVIKKDVYQLVTAASDGASVITKISRLI